MIVYTGSTASLDDLRLAPGPGDIRETDDLVVLVNASTLPRDDNGRWADRLGTFALRGGTIRHG